MEDISLLQDQNLLVENEVSYIISYLLYHCVIMCPFALGMEAGIIYSTT